MPLSETNKAQSQSIEDLIAQLDAPPNDQSSSNDRKILKGKRAAANTTSHSPNMAQSAPTHTFMKQASFGLNSEPLLSKNIITSKKYHTKHSNSRTALKAQPKKNGGGGKYTWGAPGCELVDFIDKNDPNYDSDDTANVVMVCLENSDGGGSGKHRQSANEEDQPEFDQELKELDMDDFETEIKPVLLEYFQNGDTIEVVDHLKCYNFYRLRPQLISYLVQMALEHNNTCKELTSRLLRDLTIELFAEKDFVHGFDLLLKNLSDLVLDCPDACDKIGTFVARAIADKAIGKQYLDRFFNDEENNAGDLPDIKSEKVSKAIESARVLVNMNDHLFHLSHIWGNKGGFLAVKELTDKINEIIQEYHDAGDVTEAIRCLKELAVPHFHHEFVYDALDFALQKGTDNAIELITTLLQRLCESVVVTYDQLRIGIVRILDVLPDISLDVPNASNLMDKILTKCYAKGFIGENLLELAPNRSRKRFVSEGDGGKVKE